MKPLKTLLKQVLPVLSSVTAVTLLVSCGQGLQTSPQKVAEQAVTSVCGSNCTTPAPWSKAQMQGKMSGGPYNEAQAIALDPNKQTIKLLIPLPSNPFGEFTIEIPKLKGATFLISQDANGNWGAGIEIPLRFIIKGIQAGTPPTRLPNGDPLPGVPDGELPQYGLKISKSNLDAYVYLGIQAAAVYIPIPKFNPFISILVPIHNESDRKTIGYFSLVPAKNGFDGGVYVSVIIPDEIAQIIDDLL